MKKISLLVNLGMIVLLSACGVPATPTPTQLPTAAVPTSLPAITPTRPAATSSPTTAAPTTSAACTDAAAFVADVTIPDFSHLDQREAFTKTWRVKNVGTCTWTADYKAMYSRGDALGAPTSIALSETAPGATLDISADMAAPSADGKFEIIYQLTNAAGNAMPIDAGDSLWAIITVGKVFASHPATPTSSASSSSGGGADPSTAGCVAQGNADFLAQTFRLINAARAANGLSALTLNDKLTTAAQSHSEDMACNSYLNHTGWNGSTSRLAHRRRRLCRIHHPGEHLCPAAPIWRESTGSCGLVDERSNPSRCHS